MKYLVLICFTAFAAAGCKLSNNNSNGADNKELAALFDKYYQERMQLLPLEATANGDNRFSQIS